MDKGKAIDKILKCLALSKSSNEHEAAAALRQARALMEKYGLEDADLLAAKASQQSQRSGARTKPVLWETHLAHKIADTFGCRLIFSQGFKASQWLFVGCGSTPEIATYAFKVLMRQAKAARSTYVKEKLSRCKAKTKVARADLFCVGWVQTATAALEKFIPEREAETAIRAYVETHFPSLGDLKPRDRHEGKRLNERAWDDISAGSKAGKGAQLHHGVNGGSDQPALLPGG